MIYCLSLVQHNNHFLIAKNAMRTSIRYCSVGQACAMHHWWKWCVCFVYFLKQSIYFLLDKNYCRKMQSVWGWTSARWVNYPWQRNIKKYIVQTFEPCVKQRFAPKLAVCYWLYNVNLIKNPKLFIILVWRGGPTSSERGSSIAKTWWSCPLLWASHMESL